jgi:hypothetical protein
MHLIQNIMRKSIAHNAITLLTAITLSIAMATDAMAAGRPGGGGHGGGGGFGGGHIGGGFGGTLLDRVPSMPPPVFNQSSPYTVPAPRETPVSPASPGSIFGNG